MNVLGIENLENRRVWASLHGISNGKAKSIGKVKTSIRIFDQFFKGIGVDGTSTGSIDAALGRLRRQKM